MIVQSFASLLSLFLLHPALLLLCSLTSNETYAAPAAATVPNPHRVQQIAAWLPSKTTGSGPHNSDRAAWNALAIKPEWAAVLKEARSLAKQPIPPLTDDLYLDFSKTGNRSRCQRVLSARDSRVTTLALAECLENRGHFLKPLSEAIQAQCNENTWVLPAHDRNLDNFRGRIVDMDLRATLVGWELATVHYLLGDRLPEATRDLIRKEVQRRILLPFHAIVEGRQSGAYWLKATHNWNSVCLAGVTGAALALEPNPAERAWFVAVAEHYIQNFLRGFSPDGYCSEGLGYWNYGFGRFLMLGEAIRQATGGQIDLLGLPNAAAPALYFTRTEIINGLYPPIADCRAGTQPDPLYARYITDRFQLASNAGNENYDEAPGHGLAPTLMFAFLPCPLPTLPQPDSSSFSPLRTWFKDGGVLICRPQPGASTQFAAVLKGGNNAEHHNHNDVGSFSVVLNRNMLLCDPGSEVYTARTFSSRRYDSKVLNSFGHAVPVLAGKIQQPGAQARATVLNSKFSDAADTLALDIRSAYPVPTLKKMERSFTFRRGDSPSLLVKDDFAFSAPETFESALITWGNWKQTSPTELLISEGTDSVKIQIDTAGQPIQVSSELLDEDVTTRTKPTRISVRLADPVQSGTVSFTITPSEA